MVVFNLGRVQRRRGGELPIPPAGPDGITLRLVVRVAVDEEDAEATGLGLQVIVDFFVATVDLQDEARVVRGQDGFDPGLVLEGGGVEDVTLLNKPMSS